MRLLFPLLAFATLSTLSPACAYYFANLVEHSDSTEAISEAVERLGLTMSSRSENGLKYVEMKNKKGEVVAHVGFVMGVHQGEIGIEIETIRVDDPELRGRDISTLLMAAALQKSPRARFVFALMSETNLNAYVESNSAAATPLGKSVAKFGFTHIDDKGITRQRTGKYAPVYFHLGSTNSMTPLPPKEAAKMVEKMDRRSAVGQALPEDFGKRLAAAGVAPGDFFKVDESYDAAKHLLSVTGIGRIKDITPDVAARLAKAGVEPELIPLYLLQKRITAEYPDLKTISFRRPTFETDYGPKPEDFAKTLGFAKAKGVREIFPSVFSRVPDLYESFEK